MIKKIFLGGMIFFLFKCAPTPYITEENFEEKLRSSKTITGIYSEIGQINQKLGKIEKQIESFQGKRYELEKKIYIPERVERKWIGRKWEAKYGTLEYLGDGWIRYTVRRGDCLWKIIRNGLISLARDNSYIAYVVRNFDESQLMSHNKDLIYPGEVLEIKITP